MTIAHSLKLPRETQASTLRVLHVRTVCGNGGGPEKTLFNSPKYLPALGVEAEALYLLDANTDSDALKARAEQSPMPVHFVMEKSALDVRCVSAFTRLIRGGNFHVVHTHDYKSNTLARMLFATGSYKIVATAHGYNQTTRREGCYYALEKMLLRRADAVICPSKILAADLADSGVSPSRLHVIPNAIEPSQWEFRRRPIATQNPQIIYAGRLSREKNVQAILQAVAMLARRGDSSYHVKLIGEGPERPRLEQLACELAIAERVEFAGLVKDVRPLLAAGDIFVNPSSTEAMPNSVLEALAVGVPVIATDVGDTAELVKTGESGILIAPGDIAALAGAIAELKSDSDAARIMAIRGRSIIEDRFDFAQRMAHVVALYRGVLAKDR